MTPNAELRSVLRTWQSRLRLARALDGAVYGLSAALLLVSMLSLVTARSQALLADEYLFTSTVALLLAPLLGAIAGYIWPQDPIKAARALDIRLGLKERVSTALELENASSLNPLRERQLLDALETARSADYRRGIPMRVPRLPLILFLALIFANTAFWFMGQDYFARAQQKRRILDTIERQAAEIEQIIEEISENADLTEQQKKDLIEPLQEALDSLNEAETLEEAFAALEQAREELQALENQDAKALADALKQAGESLRAEGSEDLQTLAESLANGDFEQAADDLKNLRPEDMDAADLDALAESLDNLADAVESQDPELAADLREAAEAAQAGDPQAAREALEQASQALEGLNQQVAAAEAAGQAAGQVQEGQSDIVAAGRNGGSGQTASSGTGQGNQGSQGNQGGGSGSGEGTANQGAQSGSEAGSDPISQDNSPDGTGETVFQPISPSSLGGEGGDRVAVPQSGADGDNITGVGPVDPGSDAPITVPYTEVFPQYQSAANQAVDSGAIPPQYRDLIRDYFSSLEP